MWADSRSPSTTLSVTSQDITWTSNQPTNQVNTGTLGGSVVDGTYGFFSNPHGDDTDSGLYCDEAQDPIPAECWLNDGWIITAPDGETLYGVSGWFYSNTGGAKVTFLLDGVDVNGNDTDNIENWNRDGDFVSNWTFVGVVDTNGFSSAEILELSGKDFQQQFIFGDRFSIGATTVPAPAPVAGTVAGMSLKYTYCKDLTTAATALDLALGAATSWSCSDNGLTVTSGDTAIAVMLGTKTLSPTPLSGSISGISPVVAICTNRTTGSQVFVPLGASGNWDCEAGGFMASPGDLVRIILYGTVP